MHFQFWRETNDLHVAWGSGSPYSSEADGFKKIDKEGEYGWHIGPEGGSEENKQRGWNSYGEFHLDNDADFYITVTLDPKITDTKNGKVVCKQILYVNGEKKSEGWYYEEIWEKLEASLSNLKCFCLGSSSQNGEGGWWTGKIKCRNLKLYSKALDEEKVKQSYDKAMEYYSDVE